MVPGSVRDAGSGVVALVKDKVDDGQNRGQALRQQVVRRHSIRDMCLANLALETPRRSGCSVSNTGEKKR